MWYLFAATVYNILIIMLIWCYCNVVPYSIKLIKLTLSLSRVLANRSVDRITVSISVWHYVQGVFSENSIRKLLIWWARKELVEESEWGMGGGEQSITGIRPWTQWPATYLIGYVDCRVSETRTVDIVAFYRKRICLSLTSHDVWSRRISHRWHSYKSCS